MYKEEEQRNKIRINQILSRFNILFLILIPLIIALEYSHMLNYSVKELIGIFGFILSVSIIPFLVNKFSYEENFIAAITLVCMELMMLFASLNPFNEISYIYIVIPIISLLYCDVHFMQRISLICYIGMVISIFIRVSHIDTVQNIYVRNESIYFEFLKYTFEYLLVYILLYFITKFMNKRMMEVTVLKDSKPQNGNVIYDTNVTKESDKQIQSASYDVLGFWKKLDSDIHRIIKGKEKIFILSIDEHLPSALLGESELLAKAMMGICYDFLMYQPKTYVDMNVSYNMEITPKINEYIQLEIVITSPSYIKAAVANKTALGYSLTQKFVNELKGSIIEQSTDDETSYKITLMQKVVDEMTLEQRREQQNLELIKIKQEARRKRTHQIYKKKVKALVVDDNLEVCKLVEALLSEIGVTVDFANTGTKALQMLESKEYEMVFLDYMMPEKSGLETLKEIRYLDDIYYTKLPVVLMSVNKDADSHKEYCELGFSDSIHKPVSREQIHNVFQKWVKDDALTYEEYRRRQEKRYEG